MPDNIDRITRELEKLQQESNSARASLDGLTRSLENLLAASARGGTPTTGRVSDVARNLIEGNLPSGQRTRVGGGAYLPGNRDFVRQVNEILGQIIRFQQDQVLTDLRRQVVERARVQPTARTVGADYTLNPDLATYQKHAQVMATSEGTPLGQKLEVAKYSAELAASYKRMVREVSDQLKEAIEQNRTITEEIKASASPEVQARHAQVMGAKSTQDLMAYDLIKRGEEAKRLLDQQFEELRGRLEQVTTSAERDTENVNVQGLTLGPISSFERKYRELVKELTEGIAKRAEKVANEPTITGYDPIATRLRNIQAALQRQKIGPGALDKDYDINQKQAVYDAFGNKQPSIRGTDFVQYLGKDSVALKQYNDRLNELKASIIGADRQIISITGSVQKQVSGFTKLNTVVRDNLNVSSQMTLYLTKDNKLLDENALRAELAARAQERLASSVRSRLEGIGRGTSQRVLNLAGQYGFGEEHLKGMYTQAPAGLSFLTFRKQAQDISGADIPGMYEKLEVSVDRAGKVITRTHRRLLSFTQSIIRNTQELLKWSIGIGLVYGSFFRLQRLIQTAIENQSKLADVAIALGDAQRDLNSIFDDAAAVAKETGESINDVLESYTLAYRAVGAIQDPIKRTAAANKLLTDATILNKLSTLDAASSIDVLAGSLRQLQGPGESTADVFDRGRSLLDQWVALTRKANVDLATLATAFSITAESADNAGVSTQQLNAIIASLAEKIGGLGGRETGNAVRALIGGVYQQQAVEILARYGIAVDDASGKMRDFLDISKDVYDLYSAGIIDETQLNKIGYVLGGGVRRGQQYVAFLSDFARIQELVAEQTDSTGASQDALGRKLETVETATTRLNNGMQELAQTLGSEGGVLGLSTALLTSLTGIVNIIDKLSTALGGITIPAALLGIMSLVFSGQVGGRRKELFESGIVSRFIGWGGGIGGALGGFQGRGYSAYGQDLFRTAGVNRGMDYGYGVGRQAAKWGLPLLFASLPAISRAGEGDLRGSFIDIVGAAFGAVAGGPTGAIIGAGIADAFVRQMEASKGQIEDVLRIPLLEPENLPVPGEVGSRERARQRVEDLSTSFLGGTVSADITSGLYRIFGEIAQGLGIKGRGAYEGVDLAALTQPQMARLQAEQMIQMAEAVGKVPPESAVALIEAIEAFENLSPDEILPEDTLFTQFQNRFAGLFDNTILDIANKYRSDLLKQSVAGEIRPAQYRTGVERTQGLVSTVARTMTALSSETLNLNEALGISQSEVEKLSKIILDATDEDILAITQLIGEIEDLDKIIQSLADDAPDAMAEFRGASLTSADAVELVNTRVKELTGLLTLVEQSAALRRIQNIQAPTIVGAEGYTQEQARAIENLAKTLQDERFQTFIENGIPGWTDETARDMITNAEPVFLYLGQRFGYYLVKGITDSSILKDAIEQAIEDGITPAISDLGYEFFDFTQAQLESILPEYNRIRQQILGAGGTSTEEGLLAFFKDATSPVYMEKDWKIVQYLLQQILKTEEKQLDGIYNLPTGAGFYVPWSAYKLQPTGEPGGEGMASDTFSAAVDKFAAHVETLSRQRESASEWRESFRQSMIERDKRLEEIEKRNIREEGLMEQRYPASAWRESIRSGMIQAEAGVTYKPHEIPEMYPGTIAGFADSLGDAIKESLWSGDLSMFTEVTIPNLKNVFDNFINSAKEIFGNLFSPTPDIPEDTTSSTQTPEVTTALNINLTSQTQLIVDGRTLADVIKPYLMEDMVNYQGAAGSATRDYTVV